jgi:site-specific recombinase XerD
MPPQPSSPLPGQKSQFKAPGDLVFCTREGKPLHHRTVRRDVIERTRKRVKVRHFTMHSLRHSFATSLLQAGAAITEVQRYMGHKSAHVTLDVYAHFIPTADSGAVTAHVAKLFPNGQVLDTSAAPSGTDATGAAVSG